MLFVLLDKREILIDCETLIAGELHDYRQISRESFYEDISFCLFKRAQPLDIFNEVLLETENEARTIWSIFTTKIEH